MAIESNNVDDHVNKIDLVPHDVFLDIVCRLPITSLVQCRFVCKAWNKKLSHDPELVNLQLAHAVKNDPCLIFHVKNKLCFVDLSDSDNNEKVRKLNLPFLPAFTGYRVKSSCNGLLCISRSFHFDTLYICNPFTGKYKELPKAIAFEKQVQVTFGFGFHPSTNVYKVVKIVYYLNPQFRNYRARSLTRIQSDIQILDLSSNKWRSIGKAPYMLDENSTGVLVNGRLHWVTAKGSLQDNIIVSFDLCDEGFQEIPRFDDFKDSIITYDDYYSISALGGCLCVGLTSFSDDIDLQLWVMKEYSVKESWECVCTIRPNLPMHVLQDPTMAEIAMSLEEKASLSTYSALCRLKNGEILLDTLEWECRDENASLLLYDPKSKERRILRGMRSYIFLVHVASLSWID